MARDLTLSRLQVACGGPPLTVALAFAFVSAVLLVGCRSQPGKSERSASSAAVQRELEPDELIRLVQLAEYRRASDAVPKSALTHREASVRRLAARTLARIADEKAAELLFDALADEDAEVTAWAAYGLGYACESRETRVVRAVVARAAGLVAQPIATAPTERRFVVEPWAGITDALVRCGTPDAEATLRSWLSGHDARAQHTALALSRLAERRRRLEDATLIALLDAASRPAEPIYDALAPIAYLRQLGDAAKERLLDVAVHALDIGGRARTFAIRALPRAGPIAVKPLTKIVADTAASSVDRTLASQQLADLAAEGQAGLREALAAVIPREPSAEQLSHDGWVPLLATLQALEPPIGAVADRVRIAANWPLAEKAPALRRRIIAVRCAAASLLAGDASLARSLLQCDPDGGRISALTVLEVLKRGPIEGPRWKRWRPFADASDPAVRRAAIALISDHGEIRDTPQILASALRSEDAGVVATAARILARHPSRASSTVAVKPAKAAANNKVASPKAAEKATTRSETAPASDSLKDAPAADPLVVAALSAAIDRKRAPDEIETTGLLLQAAGALQILSTKPKAEALCKSPNPTLRRHARTALRLLGDAKSTCDAPDKPEESPMPVLAAQTVTLTFVTDAERLGMTLDPQLAPAAVARIVDLARSGFYNGMPIHRVVPGFVVQFGDPTGGGYGGSGRPPLRCETSPVPFDALRVGLALSGRDTGSSQVFVTLSPQPHLDGDYPLLGTADPEWRTVAEGDVIREVVVTE